MGQRRQRERRRHPLTWRRAFALLLPALALSQLVPVGASAQTEPGHEYPWTLAKIADRNISLTLDSPKVERDLAFDLPKDAQQGAPYWYLMRVKSVAQLLPPDGSEAKAIVSADLNGRTSAQIVYTRDESGRVSVDSLGELGGGVNQYTAGVSAVPQDFVNYVVDSSVKAGQARLTLRVEAVIGRLISRVTFGPETGIGRTLIYPEQYTVVVPASTIMTLGKTHTVTAQVKRRGQRADLPVTISAASPDPRLQIVSDAVTLERVNDSATVEIRVRATAPGQYLLTTSIESSFNDAFGTTTVAVESRDRRGLPLVWPIALLAVALSIVELSRRRRRRARRE